MMQNYIGRICSEYLYVLSLYVVWEFLFVWTRNRIGCSCDDPQLQPEYHQPGDVNIVYEWGDEKMEHVKSCYDLYAVKLATV